MVTDHIVDVLTPQGAQDISLSGPHDNNMGTVHLEHESLHGLTATFIIGQSPSSHLCRLRSSSGQGRRFHSKPRTTQPNLLCWVFGMVVANGVRTTSTCVVHTGQTMESCCSQAEALSRDLCPKMNGWRPKRSSKASRPPF